jgi:dihydroxyacetone kinase
MKKLINSSENVVLESITGLGAAFSDLIKVHTNPDYIIRADAPVKKKVALVSGGGSGHEPMHGGFVGRGMLDAACPGAVFTSPTPDQMFEATNGNGRSMGMALTSCTVPHVGKPTFDLPEDEMEIGIGIHGEPGKTRTKLESADKITETLLAPIIEDLPFKAGNEVLLFVNSMGGTPLLELFIVYRKAHEILTKTGIKVTRSLVGPYITSLEMAGASITVLKLDAELTKLWDAPVLTPALRWGT